MARRIAGDGLVTVSLRKSTMGVGMGFHTPMNLTRQAL
jgi:hypothetical protein